MQRAVIYGNGSLARNAYYELTNDMSYEVAAFTVDREYIHEEMLLGCPVVPFDTVAATYPPGEHSMSVAVGYIQINRIRAERYRRAQEMGYRVLNLVSPYARVGTELPSDCNCRIGAYSVIHPTARIGHNVYIGAGCVVAHDVVIEDHCFLSDSVNLPGFVRVGAYSYLGPNVTVRNRIVIARECVVGAGAVILEDTEERGVYMAHTAQQLPISSDRLSLA